MRGCLEKHSCLSSPFPVAILNGTCSLCAPILFCGDVTAIKKQTTNKQTTNKQTTNKQTTNKRTTNKQTTNKQTTNKQTKTKLNRNIIVSHKWFKSYLGERNQITAHKQLMV